MVAQAREAGWLQGKQVSFTGCLASMTRAEASALVARHGGQVVAAVSQQTDFLVVGQEKGPLDREGRLTHQLQKARRLQRQGSGILILAEEDFLAQLGLETTSTGIHRLYSTAQLCRILRIKRVQIQAWLRAGLIQPAQAIDGIDCFDYRQVSWAKTLCELARAGVTTQRIRQSLEQVRKWLPEVEQPLAQLVLFEQDGRLVVRLENGQLADTTGQPHLDFGEEPPALLADVASVRRSAEDWFQAGSQAEEEGKWAEAADAYQHALLVGGPSGDLCFNLANVLFHLGNKAGALERYRQAVEINPQLAPAWNNLGNILAELEQFDDALNAYQEALRLDPGNADAHYNLADTLETLGHDAEARPHWIAYLGLEPSGQWADYARRRLEKP